MILDSDRTLIEYAASMNGFQVKGWIGDKLNYFDPILDYEGFGDWNPLTNSADAFELAVKFNVRICTGGAYDGAGWIMSEGKDSVDSTRRAITQVVAWKYKNA